jgi:hypothetical protein
MPVIIGGAMVRKATQPTVRVKGNMGAPRTEQDGTKISCLVVKLVA